jgi:hypothetical protein
MNAEGLPTEVEQLIEQALPTMVHVELLLLLHRTAPSCWSVAGAAGELRTSAPLIDAAFVDLETARLAARAAGRSPSEWCLDPSDDGRLTATTKLREAYERRPVTLVKALYRRPASPVQAFADAFRLRPKDS